jgi:tRNA nucleotidyltransferase (CCA-adding enzyme)
MSESEIAKSENATMRQGWTPEETLEQYRQHKESGDLVAAFQASVALSRQVSEAGGTAYIVGGAVRDELLGLPPHDLDLEVHGLEANQVENLLTYFGSSDMTGKNFGTYKFRVGQSEVQIALPRRDQQVGPRHNDVQVELHPEFSIPEAARRRDFTIGAMYKNLLNGEITDPFNGAEDLASKTLRMVDGSSFSEDPLRVIRGARFAAKFDLTVDPETRTAMQAMVERLGHLPKERLRDEWTRLLTETSHPSRALELLRDLGALERWQPELARLWQTPQDPEHHPEGDVGRHTLMAIDAAAEFATTYGLDAHDRRLVMFGTLAHDLGKPLVTTEEHGRIRALGHELAGAGPAEKFLTGIGIPTTIQQRIIPLVTEHMRPALLYANRDEITDRALRKLARDVGPHLMTPLLVVAEADHRGRGPFLNAQGQTTQPDTSGFHRWWSEQQQRLHLTTPPEPLLWGRDFVNHGWQPGPLIGQALRLTEELAITGIQRDEILQLLDQASTPESAIGLLRERLTAAPTTLATTVEDGVDSHSSAG